jgi:hypothetical protein
MKKLSHPYKIHEKSDLWQVVSQALADLTENGDIAEQTRREYIIGYLCEKLREGGFQRVELRAGTEVSYVVQLRPAKPNAKAG